MTPFRSFAHLLLLTAAVLQFGTAVLGPWAHLADSGAAAASTWTAADPAPDGGGRSLHHEGDCALCHTLAAVAFLPVATTAPSAIQRADDRAPDPAAPAPSPVVSFPSARGPPAS